MGLDAVDLIIRAEEFFGINISDEEAALIRTVGDFYKLICRELSVPPLQSPVTPVNLPVVTQKEKQFIFLQKHTPLPAPPEVLPWSQQSVWGSLIAVIADQLCIDPKEVVYHARFVEDLRVD